MKIAPTATALILIAYPFISHFGVLTGEPALPLFWLSLLFLSSFLVARRSLAWLSLAGMTFLLMALALVFDYGETLQKAPPIVISAAMALVFGRTLLPGRRPLISHIGEQMRGELPPQVDRYGRRLTWVWTLFFIAMALESLFLALFADPYVWSLFTNFLNYGIILILFVAEYPVRRFVLRDLEHTSFFDSLRGSLSVRYH